MKKLKLKFIMPILGSTLLFVSLIIINKTVGYTHVADLYTTTQLTWNEIYENIPRYLVFSFAFGVFTYILFSQAEKNNK